MALLSSKAVGSIVKLNVNGASKNFIVVHQGIPYTSYDSSCDGTWLLMEDLYELRTWDSSNNDYANSDIHSYLNNTFINLFDSDIKSVIKQVKIPYTKGTGSSGSLQTGSSGISAKVFLLSCKEIGHIIYNSTFANNEGYPLSYFNSVSGSKKVAKFNGTITNWWLRSPQTAGTVGAWRIDSNGSAGVTSIENSLGVRPAMILPGTLNVDNGGNIYTNTAPTTPGTPTLSNEVIAGESCSVSWTAATDAESAVSYKLEVSIDGGAWTQVYDGANRSYSYPVSSGTSTIAFRVKAYDDKGVESDYATSATATVLTRTPIGDVAVGSSVFMNVDGVRTEFLVVHQGLPGTMYDSSCDGTWLLMEDLYESRAFDSTNHDYANSDIHSYLNNTFVNLFDSDIKSAIKQVKIPYRAGSDSSTTVTSGSKGLSAKVFLLSYTEVGFSGSSYAPVEGAVLNYFNGAANSKRVAKLNGNAAEWLLRSPYTNTTNRAWFVSSGGSGSASGYGVAYSRGVRPALVLPNTVSIDSEYNIITKENGSDTPSEPEETVTSSAIIWGSYNKLSDILVNVGGAWKNYAFGYANVDGVWKEFMKASGLPSGYTQLEYIKTTGTQYINTGFNPNQDTRVVMDAQLNDYTDVSPLSAYFGVSDGIHFRVMDPSAKTNTLRVYYNTDNDNTWDVPIGNRRTIDMNGASATIDGVTQSYDRSVFQINYPIFLLASNSSGKANYYGAGKIYSCKIYDSGVLVRDFIPCLNDSGVAGLWDKVEGKFYGNAGSGSFTTN